MKPCAVPNKHCLIYLTLTQGASLGFILILWFNENAYAKVEYKIALSMKGIADI
jgi:hypothetical protein